MKRLVTETAPPRLPAASLQQSATKQTMQSHGWVITPFADSKLLCMCIYVHVLGSWMNAVLQTAIVNYQPLPNNHLESHG